MRFHTIAKIKFIYHSSLSGKITIFAMQVRKQFRPRLYKIRINMGTKKTKEERQKDWQDFLAKLKAMPPEKLSKAAKWMLENEGKRKDNVIVDMRAVLK